VAHIGLAVTGSIALIIGTAVSGIEWLAVLVTIPVAFGIFFAGVAGPNTASGVNGALFGYLLPVATPGTVSMIPDRLAGWWLVSVVAASRGQDRLPAGGPSGRPGWNRLLLVGMRSGTSCLEWVGLGGRR
jgi:hypothetical protein